MTEDLGSAWELLRSLKVLDFMHSRKLPPDAIASIDSVIDAFLVGDAEEKKQINREVDKAFSFAFFMYALMAAVDSVRQNQPVLLRRGLLAVAVENLAFDWRDSLPQVAKLYHSARKFPQIDADGLFRNVADISNEPFNELLSSFIRRPEESKSLACFGLIESIPPAPFDYEARLRKSPSRFQLYLRPLLRCWLAIFPTTYALVFAVALFPFVLGAQSDQKGPSSLTIYTSDALGFSYSYPVQLVPNTGEFRRKLNAPNFSAFETPTPGKAREGVVITSEDAAQYGPIWNAKRCLHKTSMILSQQGWTVLRTNTPTALDSQTFLRADYQHADPLVFQSAVCTIWKGSVLEFVLSAGSEEEINELFRSLETIHFREPVRKTVTP